MRPSFAASLLGRTWGALFLRFGVAPRAPRSSRQGRRLPGHNANGAERSTARRPGGVFGGPGFLRLNSRRPWPHLGGITFPWLLLLALRTAPAVAAPEPDPAPSAPVEVRREARTPRPARTAPVEPRTRTITTIATVRTEGRPTLEGWMNGLDYADLADAIWSSTCRKPSL